MTATTTPGRSVSPWFTGAVGSDRPARLICFPHAGAGAAAYGRWAQLLPPTVALHVLQAPGRESRHREPPCREVDTLVAQLLPSLAALLDRPTALFGHSLGAIVAFEVARAVRASNLPAPTHLYVSGRPAPDVVPASPPAWRLSDDDLLSLVRQLGGTPEAILSDPVVVRSFVLPALRADLEMNEEYRWVPGSPLDVPITAFAATEDARATQADMAGWHRHTTSGFDLVPVVGGHFAIMESPGIVTARATADNGWGLS